MYGINKLMLDTACFYVPIQTHFGLQTSFFFFVPRTTKYMLKDYQHL